MTICVVCDVLGRENNGTTIAAMNLIRSLRDKGHTVRVICPDKERSGEQDYYIVPTLPLGPLNNYVRKNGVVIARPKKQVLEAALEGVAIYSIFLSGKKYLADSQAAGIGFTSKSADCSAFFTSL